MLFFEAIRQPADGFLFCKKAIIVTYCCATIKCSSENRLIATSVRNLFITVASFKLTNVPYVTGGTIYVLCAFFVLFASLFGSQRTRRTAEIAKYNITNNGHYSGIEHLWLIAWEPLPDKE
jgi:hypothetical protein